jgi:hypothetical protein
MLVVCVPLVVIGIAIQIMSTTSGAVLVHLLLAVEPFIGSLSVDGAFCGVPCEIFFLSDSQMTSGIR